MTANLYLEAEHAIALSTIELLRATNIDLNRKLMDSRMEAMVLRDQVARFTKAAVVVVAAHYPFREFKKDRRRVGG